MTNLPPTGPPIEAREPSRPLDGSEPLFEQTVLEHPNLYPELVTNVLGMVILRRLIPQNNLLGDPGFSAEYYEAHGPSEHGFYATPTPPALNDTLVNVDQPWGVPPSPEADANLEVRLADIAEAEFAVRTPDPAVRISDEAEYGGYSPRTTRDRLLLDRAAVASYRSRKLMFSQLTPRQQAMTRPRRVK